MEVAFKSHIGHIRQVNEDSADVYYRENNTVLAVVADGMGGHQAGDVASQMTLQKLQESFAVVDLNKDIAGWSEWLLEAIKAANHYVYQYSLENAQYQGMGTTIVAALFLDSDYIVAHVGDSRVYRFADQQLHQITEDHSLVYELVRSGQLTQEEADSHPQRNIITRALGTEEEVEIDLKVLSYLGGEQLLLCSDGLSNMVQDSAITEILSKSDTVEEKVNELIHRALEAGGDDNISLVVIQTEAEETKGK